MKSRDGRTLRVLGADDSAVMRGVLRTVFQLHASDGDPALPKMELVGVVRDGVEALEAVRSLQPDVLLLDLEMPRLNGLGVLAQLRSEAPELPVIMCSAHTERGARSTLDALAHGAKDYVMKPGQQKDFASALDTLMEQLLPKIAALAGARTAAHAEPKPRAGDRLEITPGAHEAPPPRMGSANGASLATRVEVVVIGVSTGGPAALESMLPKLPADFAAPILIVQHMPRLFTSALANRLNGMCRMPVAQAREGAIIAPGTIWLAPGDAHMEIAAGERGRLVKLHQQIALNSCKPSADYLFRSAARLCGSGTLGLIMTGMGQDGLEGARAVREAGGTVFAQDQASSAVWGMPKRVVECGFASATFPLDALAGALLQRVQAGRGYGPASALFGPRPDAASRTESRKEVSYGML